MISLLHLRVILGFVYLVVSGIGQNISESHDTTDSKISSSELYLQSETRITGRANGLTEPATSKGFISTEAFINNATELQTSNFVSADDRNKTETSLFSSYSNTAITKELSPTERWMSATAVSNIDVYEITRTRTVTEMSTTVTSTTTENTDECKPDNCISPGNCIFTKNSGCIRLREDETKKSISYNITLANEASLIYLDMEPETENLFLGSSITFQFEECEELQDEWKLKEGKKMTRKIYISRTSNLTLHMFTDKSWINCILRYKELASEATEDRAEDTVDEGNLVPPMLAGIRYRPSTNVTYLLTASKRRWNESSVMMTLSFVDLDDGDYLLIGAGNKPFAGPAPFYFTGRIRNSRTYYVASDNVYVLFVSGASQKVDKKGFHMRWKRSGREITKPDDENEEELIPDYIIQSVGICFYNKSLLAEFNTTEDYKGPIQKFQEKLAAVANSYAKKNSIMLDAVLTDSSVEIVRVSSVMDPTEDMPEGGLYVMVSIVYHFDRKNAVFRRRQLEEIINDLEKKNEESKYLMLGFKAGHCPQVKSNVEWYIASVLLVLISTIALIIVWIYTSLSKWRGFRNRRKSSDRLRNKYCKEPAVPAQENDYIRYTPGISKPQVKVTTSDGDNITLESEDLDQPMSDQEDGPDRMVYHDNWILKRRPSSNEVQGDVTTVAEIETKQFFRTFAAPVPSPKKEVHSRMWTDMPMNSLLSQASTQPVDHEYDSLVFSSTNARSTTCLVTDESETRL